ncbi:MAG: LCCL domain-containing protein [Rhodoplanes sp.]|jgi:Caspase domain/LCCL domain
MGASSSRSRSLRQAGALSGRLLAAVVCCWCLLAGAAAAKRVALVVGIDAYQNQPRLARAVSDARAVTAALGDLGFTVITGENVTRREMNRKLADLEGLISPGDTVFFFFAGHGVALGPDNILLAADMPKPGPGEDGLVRDEGFSVDNIIRRIQGRGALTSFFVLDACRDNPFEATGTRNIGGTRGLTRTEAPRGVFILYSAGIGQTALDTLRPDDPDPNSVFTRKLVPLLRTPGLSHVLLAKRVQQEVDALAATVRHAQQPAYYDQIVGEFVLRGAPDAEAARPEPVAPAASLAPTQAQPPEPGPKRNGSGATAALDPRGDIEQPPRTVTPPAQPCPDRFSAWKAWADELTCYCAPAQMGGSVWGSGFYTHDSSVCAAAKHAGVVAGAGGVVRLRAAPGQPRYAGSLRHGVMTADWGRFDGSFLFTSPVVASREPGAETSCPANVTALRGTKQSLTCQCPPRQMAGQVWGSGIYTDDSAPCLAAVHAGIIGASGGEVTLVPLPGRPSYAGSTKNGITSSSYGRWHGSFRFVR